MRFFPLAKLRLLWTGCKNPRCQCEGWAASKEPGRLGFSSLWQTENAPPKLDTVLNLETDVNGQASFSLPEPAPAHLGAVVRLTSENWHCACLALADTHEVIRNGITVTQTSQKSAAPPPLQAQPGEILFTPRPLTFFERILQPLMRQ